MFPIIWSHVLDTAHFESGVSKRKKQLFMISQ